MTVSLVLPLWCHHRQVADLGSEPSDDLAICSYASRRMCSLDQTTPGVKRYLTDRSRLAHEPYLQRPIVGYTLAPWPEAEQRSQESAPRARRAATRPTSALSPRGAWACRTSVLSSARCWAGARLRVEPRQVKRLALESPQVQQRAAQRLGWPNWLRSYCSSRASASSLVAHLVTIWPGKWITTSTTPFASALTSNGPSSSTSSGSPTISAASSCWASRMAVM